MATNELFYPNASSQPIILLFIHIKNRLLHRATNVWHLPQMQSHKADGWTYVQPQLTAHVAIGTQQHHASFGCFLEELFFINKTLTSWDRCNPVLLQSETFKWTLASFFWWSFKGTPFLSSWKHMKINYMTPNLKTVTHGERFLMEVFRFHSRKFLH